MVWFILAVIVALGLFFFLKHQKKPDLSILPEQFIVFDLETTGLKPETHEIIEIGAIRVNRDSEHHVTFQTLIRPRKKIPKKITEITGITQEMADKQGQLIEQALPKFIDFIGDLPLVSFNAEFDMAFLKNAMKQVQPRTSIRNKVSCALKMARRAWPDRKSYKLTDLAKDGGLSSAGTHRALGDCERAMIVYVAAASRLGSPSAVHRSKSAARCQSA